jgi:hypothetical protein
VNRCGSGVITHVKYSIPVTEAFRIPGGCVVEDPECPRSISSVAVDDGCPATAEEPVRASPGSARIVATPDTAGPGSARISRIAATRIAHRGGPGSARIVATPDMLHDTAGQRAYRAVDDISISLSLSRRADVGYPRSLSLSLDTTGQRVHRAVNDISTAADDLLNCTCDRSISNGAVDDGWGFQIARGMKG